MFVRDVSFGTHLSERIFRQAPLARIVRRVMGECVSPGTSVCSISSGPMGYRLASIIEPVRYQTGTDLPTGTELRQQFGKTNRKSARPTAKTVREWIEGRRGTVSRTPISLTPFREPHAQPPEARNAWLPVPVCISMMSLRLRTCTPPHGTVPGGFSHPVGSFVGE